MKLVLLTLLTLALAAGSFSLHPRDADQMKSYLARMEDQAVRDAALRYLSRDPAAREALGLREIASVDVNGEAAMARVVVVDPGARVADSLSLLRVDGEWKVVGRISHDLQPTWRG